jgi:hypothetical protein
MPDVKLEAAVALVEQSITEIMQAVATGATLKIETHRSRPVLHAHTFIDVGDRIVASLESESRARYFKVSGDAALTRPTTLESTTIGALGPVLVELAKQWRATPA